MTTLWAVTLSLSLTCSVAVTFANIMWYLHQGAQVGVGAGLGVGGGPSAAVCHSMFSGCQGGNLQWKTGLTESGMTTQPICSLPKLDCKQAALVYGAAQRDSVDMDRNPINCQF